MESHNDEALKRLLSCISPGRQRVLCSLKGSILAAEQDGNGAVNFSEFAQRRGRQAVCMTWNWNAFSGPFRERESREEKVHKVPLLRPLVLCMPVYRHLRSLGALAGCGVFPACGLIALFMAHTPQMPWGRSVLGMVWPPNSNPMHALCSNPDIMACFCRGGLGLA